MNKVKQISSLNESELKLNSYNSSWHDQYKHSAYVYIGGLHTGLTEGDVITILSQFGEIADINMPKDKSNGKSRGFGFVMFEDQRSTILAVDNLNGSQVLGRTLRVDHVDNYKQPKANKDEEPVTESMNASWQLHANKDHDEDENENENEDSDTLDPMAEYIKQQQNSSKSKDKEERKKRKLERAHKRELKELKRKRI